MAVAKEPSTHFGGLVRQQRELRNMSQEELAEVVDVAKSTVMDMEIGPVRSRPVEHILRLTAWSGLPLYTWVQALKDDGLDVTYVTDEHQWPADLAEMATLAGDLPQAMRDILLEQARALWRRYKKDQPGGE